MDEQMDAVDDFFLSKNMEVSEFTVLDSGKDQIDPESLKKMGGRRIARLNSTSLHHNDSQ